jgi:hypothetical protein
MTTIPTPVTQEGFTRKAEPGQLSGWWSSTPSKAAFLACSQLVSEE